MIALLLALVGCGAPPPPPPPGTPLVLMVSFDTTRADALSCYGGANASTPALDGLAARGVRFEWALSHVPTTLASHTTVFSGQDVHGVAIPRNGYPLQSALPLLTERFRDAGWDTLAVIGASALEHAMGLHRGFRVYDDNVDQHVGRRYEADADDVTDRAIRAIDSRIPGKPVLLFVHYYDAHMPWDNAPRAVQKRFIDPNYKGPAGVSDGAERELSRRVRQGNILPEDLAQARAYYLAEVAWADSQLGRLIEHLDQTGMLKDSLVLMFSDHGESLGEPTALAPFGHGPDVDLPEIHVPLIIAGQGSFSVPTAVVSRQVRLVDVASTLLGLAGLDGTIGTGEDLRPLFMGGAVSGEVPVAPASFAEATMPLGKISHTSWNNLPLERSVAKDGKLLVYAPWLHEPPRLYQIAPDQPEILNDPAAIMALRHALVLWDAAAPPGRFNKLTGETEEALQALGYVEE